MTKWQLREVAPDLRDRYLAEGWWTDDTLGSTAAAGLAAMADEHFRVHSAVRPWRGTFGDVDRKARALAGALHARGVGPGDVVVFQMPNWVEAGITFFATAYLGATIVPIVHFYGPKEVGYILDVVQPKVIVTPDKFGFSDHLAMYTELLATRPDPMWLVTPSGDDVALPERATRFESLLDHEPLAEPIVVDPDEPAIIGFTSGTTSNPKGVVHSHRTMTFETRQLGALMPEGPPQVTGAPVGHFIGMLNTFLLPLLSVRPVNMVDVWDPGNVLRLMKEEHIGLGGGATFFLTSLLDHPDFTEEHLEYMPYCGLGGSAVPAAVMDRAAKLGITAWRAYGSTEHPSITSCEYGDPESKRHTTDGKPLMGVEMKLSDEGEILSRGPDLCMGYTDPELTAKVFDADGWYHTGDVCVQDADGYITITDRLGDFIIRGGENVSAQEIEELVLQMAGIAEVAVVAAPDERLGEHAAAILRLLPEATAPLLDAIRAHLAERGLAKQKWPESLYVVADFPRTASGKVQKFVLRQKVREGELA